ncbi:MAG: DapH/DapD/GlmU-related protein [Acidobacteriaceae bacterium]
MIESMEPMVNCSIHQSARIGAGLQCGHNVVIGPNAVLGEGCRLGNGVVIHADTVIGSNVRVDDNTVIGKLPMQSSRSAITKVVQLDPCVVEDNCLIGALVVLYRGARIEKSVMVADLATVREDVSIGTATIIGRGVAVENHVTIGARCKIETGAYITALSTIAEDCFIAPEVTFTNDQFMGRTEKRFLHFKGVTMERGARVGANATILPGITIGKDAVVGAGSVVTRNVPERMMAFGSPARVMRPVPEEQLLEVKYAEIKVVGSL